MSRNRVAVLDIRSSELTVTCGERGVNHTFVFHASHTEQYDGYADGAFFDKDKLKDAIFTAITSVEKTISSRIRTLYIGVPGEFVYAEPIEQRAGFPKKRKITERETAALFESGKREKEGYRLIRATSMIYETADNRRIVNPIGLYSTSLTGTLSYFYCTDYFAETMEDIFREMKISVRYLPTEFAMAAYLIPAETRDEYAIFLDCGYQSSTISVVLGGGALVQETHPVGRIQIVMRIMQALNLPYEAAKALLPKVNLFVQGGGKTEFVFKGHAYEIDVNALTDAVKDGIDEVCEAFAGFVEECTGRELEFKPILISGEGLGDIRGALEHITRRLSRVTELLAPDLPYYNKPSMSSQIALVDMACEDDRRRGFLNRLFNTFGG